MADEQRPYTWFPTTTEEAVAINEEPTSLPTWYNPPIAVEPPINRDNEYTLPNWYVDTSVSAITDEGKYNQSFANPTQISGKLNRVNDYGATGVYTSYAGVDIVATMAIPGQTEPIDIGELQTISYSIHRENVPVRVLGRVGPRGFVKGPRTIAGSLIFTQFDKYFFYKLSTFKNHLANNLYPLSDMLPPFDVTISFSNESGSFSKLKIYGITIVDEGSTMSVDDLITEQTFTYMARGIQPLVNYLPNEFNEIIDRDYLTDPSKRSDILIIGGGNSPTPTKAIEVPAAGGSQYLIKLAQLRSEKNELIRSQGDAQYQFNTFIQLMAELGGEYVDDQNNPLYLNKKAYYEYEIAQLQNDLSHYALRIEEKDNQIFEFISKMKELGIEE
jgi:hypothetical protein